MTADTDLSMIFLDLVVGQNDKEEIFTTLVARIPPRCCPLEQGDEAAAALAACATAYRLLCDLGSSG